jgi:iron complex outermembrane receptor protein
MPAPASTCFLILACLPVRALEDPPGAVVQVTAPMPSEPLVTVLDPRNPRQPVPAQDGAEFLRLIPGFNLVRKGGTDGDPVLRGMAGSRLGILVDGEETPGGCGGRMDPPTAYVFPEAYDRIQVVKGPQTVRYGPGNSAGTVLFQRAPPHWDRPGWAAAGGWTVGGFGRFDQILDARAGTPACYGRAIGLESSCGDYRCGDGREVHSRYARWSAHAAVGWTPTPGTWLECRGTRSDGQAAYADRGMDGVGFQRRNLGLAFETRDLWDRVGKVEFQAYLNDIDHTMDNGTLRAFAPSPGFPEPRAWNPRSTTRGARCAITLYSGQDTQWILGADARGSRHDGRGSMRLGSLPVASMPRVPDATLASAGLFSEWTRACAWGGQVSAGARADQWRARDLRTLLPPPSAGQSPVPNPTAHATREQLLLSGFARCEWTPGPSGTTLFAGLGQVCRAPDYWELFPMEGVASPSAFNLRPERTLQLDLGATRQAGRIRTSLSGFFSVVSDYILIQSAFPKPTPAGSPRAATVARNIQASTWGGELALAADLAARLRLDASLAYTRGENRTDGLPLAQMPPLEARLGLACTEGAWSAGSLVRMVAPQDRVALNQGTIAGLDLGRTPGFAVWSLNAGWRPPGAPPLTFSCGIDNLFDRAYAEHINRQSSPIPGYLTPSERIQEPGRIFWLKATFKFP